MRGCPPRPTFRCSARSAPKRGFGFGFLAEKGSGRNKQGKSLHSDGSGRGYEFAAPMGTEAPRMLVDAAHTQTTAVIEEEYVDGFPEKLLEKLPAATRANGRWIWGGYGSIGHDGRRRNDCLARASTADTGWPPENCGSGFCQSLQRLTAPVTVC